MYKKAKDLKVGDKVVRATRTEVIESIGQGAQDPNKLKFYFKSGRWALYDPEAETTNSRKEYKYGM